MINHVFYVLFFSDSSNLEYGPPVIVKNEIEFSSLLSLYKIPRKILTKTVKYSSTYKVSLLLAWHVTTL